MKKLIAIFFLIIYAGAAQGMAINFHFCSGQLTGVAIGVHSGCACSDSKMPMDCCRDKVFCKKADTHSTNPANALNNASFIQLGLPPAHSFKKEAPTGNRNATLSYNLPAQRSWLPSIYLLIHVLRI